MVQTAPFRASLNFADDKTAPGAFEFPFVKLAANGESLYLSPSDVPMHDLRKETKKPTLEENGFTWVSLPFEGLDEAEGWEDRYSKFTCDYVKGITGAKDVRCINYQIRRRTPGDEDNTNANYDQAQQKVLGMQPVPAVHVDINKERARSRLLAAFDGEHEDAERVAIINVWRPLNGPIMDAPLALCDASTVDPNDMMWTTDQYGGGYFIRHNANMRWMYIHDQMPDEALIFRQFDNTIPYGKAGCVPHTAFFDDARKHLGSPRQSIELRLALVY